MVIIALVNNMGEVGRWILSIENNNDEVRHKEFLNYLDVSIEKKCKTVK